MIRLIIFLFTGCFHKWKILERIPVHQPKRDGSYSQLPVRFEYHLQCEKCGSIKIKD